MDQLAQHVLSVIADKQAISEANMAMFLDVPKNTFLTNGDRNMVMTPHIVTNVIEVPLIENEEGFCVLTALIKILREAHQVPVSSNDYNVLDYAAVEINNSKVSNAPSILIGTKKSLNNALQYHINNNTHENFQKLFIPLAVFDELMEEDEFFVVKYYGQYEGTRMFAYDVTDDSLLLCVAPFLPNRSKLVRKSVIAMNQDGMFIDHRYSQN